MIFIRAFKTTDFDAFEPIEKIGLITDPELAQAIEDSSLAVTGVRNGKVIGCGGVHPVDEFRGEMWLRLSTDCTHFPIETLRWIKEGVKIIEETYPFKQLTAMIKCGFDRSLKLIEHLGFTATGIEDGWTIYSKEINNA